MAETPATDPVGTFLHAVEPAKPLLPAEHMVYTIAKGQVSRGVNPEISTTTVLLLTIERLTGTGPGLSVGSEEGGESCG